jgi:SPP1 family predicted phage head-tail adaptor
MKAGDLRHTITFQQLTVSNDTWGKSVPTWTDEVTTRAAIWPMRGTERIEAMKLDNELTHKIRVRYRPGITAKMRIKFRRKSVTRYFNIRSILNPDERNIYLEIMATEEV